MKYVQPIAARLVVVRSISIKYYCNLSVLWTNMFELILRHGLERFSWRYSGLPLPAVCSCGLVNLWTKI